MLRVARFFRPLGAAWHFDHNERSCSLQHILFVFKAVVADGLLDLTFAATVTLPNLPRMPTVTGQANSEYDSRVSIFHC